TELYPLSLHDALPISWRLPVDVDLLSVYPHAHYLGKEMDVRARLPDGASKPLIHIKHWSFHWQQDYQYATPVALPAGTAIVMRRSEEHTSELQSPCNL